MKENDYLKKKKIKLTIVFTIIIFFVLILSELSFLGFKYFSYINGELDRLNKFSQRFTERVFSSKDVIDDMKQRFENNSGMGFSRDMMRNYPGILSIPLPRPGFNDQNVMIISNSGDLIFTSLNDEKFTEFLIKSLKNKDITNKGNYFSYSGYGYVYKFDSIKTNNGNNYIISFSQSQFTLAELGIEFLNYLLLSVILCGLLYFLGYKFVSYNLKPVEENMKDMQSFIHNAGHELKTPLSVVSSSLQLSKLQKNYDEAINESISELNRMNSLIESLIQLSTINAEISSIHINVNESINKITKYFTNQLEIKQISLNIKENAILVVNANQDYFDICFTNLISNAIKYNINGGKIDINIGKKYVEIVDTGMGISSENLNNVFERFFQEQSNRGDGFGIGLSLVKKICEIYNRKIEIKSEKQVGTRIKIIF